MTFFDFYNNHFTIITVILVLFVFIIVQLVIFIVKKTKKVKTPWFEIAPDSVKVPESEDMAKTRLLLKRQFDYVDNYINGLSNTFLSLEKLIVRDAMQVLFENQNTPKTHMETCLINADTNELIQEFKNYMNSLLVINHIGTNKEKIKKYAKSHVCQVNAIAKRHLCDIFCKLSGSICTDSLKYWKQIGIDNPSAWGEEHLTELLLGISELRYSDFDENNDTEN